ncbi:serine hydrolase domain-containing protein [Microbacterium halophytorum]|uniref:serine hydrolase domain-containing protein n=1 Tax=Microbacterium halophytorum TaxID=2067568 RepID=UPI00131A23C0|nr:serine hydrolase domain-containing protein [Microbacterium halophytorum]
MAMAAGLDRLADALDALVGERAIAGWVASAADADGLESRAGGRRALDGPAMTTGTLFFQTSCSKPYAGVIALRFAERGVLALDDPIDRWLPEFAEPRVLREPTAALDDTEPAERAITVRDLLAMTPGFGWIDEECALAAAYAERGVLPGPWPPNMPASEYVARLGSLPLANQPGRLWRYHQSSEVLGVLLARAAGAPIESVLADEVCAPIGLADTGFVGVADRMATVYDGTGTRLEPYPVPEGAGTVPPQTCSLANGIVSAIPDHATFLGSLVGVGPALLGPASARLLTTDALMEAQRAVAGDFLVEGAGWGLHVEVRPNGLIGWAGGLGTIGYADPATGRAAALGFQVGIGTPAAERAFDAFWSVFD